MTALPDGDVLVLNWSDFSELRRWIDDAQMKAMLWPQTLPAAADGAIMSWLQSRGFNSLSRFYMRVTPIVVDPKAERFTVFRDNQSAVAVQF